MRQLTAATFLLAFGIAFDAVGQVSPGAATLRVEPEVQGPIASSKSVGQKGRGRASRVSPVGLTPPSAAESAQLEAPRKQGSPPQIGFARPIAALQAEEGTGRKLEWETLEDGALVAAISVTSPGAAALRVGLRVRTVPGEAVFRFHDEAGDELFEVSGAEVLAAIAANAQAGEHGPDASTYWSPVIESATAVVEIELPAGSTPEALRMSVPMVSHLVTSAKSEFLLPKAAAYCERDATCQVAAWGTQMNAVARMVFSSGGSSYVCTGTLLADLDTTTTIPYFLTANHCIGSQSVATTLNTYWFYRSTACNSGTAGPWVKQANGATLLYNSTATDVSFLRLNATPPAGATYAGWKAGAPLALNSTVTGLHHPTGDLLKISDGSVMGYLTCTAPSNGQFSCNNTTSTLSAGFYDIAWSNGVVEPGSSGSALFDGGKYVVGQLYGGGSSCSDPAAGDSYGRFDVSFNAGLSQWLNAPPPQLLSVAKAGTGAGTVMSSPAGIACGGTCSGLFAQGTTVALTAAADSLSTFAGWSGACSGTGTCSVTMTAPANVTATFVPRDFGVAVSASVLNFSGVLESRNVTYTNNTGAAVTFIQASITSTRFGQTNNCTVVPAGASCSAVVTYYPAYGGSDNGTFTMTSTASNSPHLVLVSAPQSTTSAGARLSNLSARLRVLTGNDVMIGGFVIGGAGVKTVVVRARGPSLVPYGITTPLANPALRLVRSADNVTMATNDDWGGGPNAAAISGIGLAPSNALESALLATLEPGAYTAIVSGADGGSGTGIVEVFEVDNPDVPLVNISTRGQVLTGNDVMIGGFVIQGSAPQTVVVRARGPSLVGFGIPNAIANPMLQLVRSSDQATIAVNDDWGSAANAATITASGFAPSHPLEAAILVTLDPGAYTAIVSGAGGVTGVGIVEVFTAGM